MSTRQHYLSQCYIKNFAKVGHETFFEYDCVSKTFQTRNIKKLFAGYRYWSDTFEVGLSIKYENELANILKKLANYPIKRQVFISRDKLIIPEFLCVQIVDESDRRSISKLLLQQILIQQKSSDSSDKIPEDQLEAIFFSEGIDLGCPVLFEITQESNMPPLLLIDSIFFSFIAPSMDKEKLGNLCFVCPISSNRLVIWGNDEDCNFFARKYADINYLNLCRIEQQEKKCRIASQNNEYLVWLSNRIHQFDSRESTRITACRYNR